MTYQGQPFTIDELTVECAAADLLSIGYPFLKHYRSVWKATLGTADLSADLEIVYSVRTLW